MLGDNKCQELWFLLQQARSADELTTHDTIRYRREAERNVGSDEKLYRFDWVRANLRYGRLSVRGGAELTERIRVARTWRRSR